MEKTKTQITQITRITPNKLYKTRNGDLAFVERIVYGSYTKWPVKGYIISDYKYHPASWAIDGREVVERAGEANDYDIVSLIGNKEDYPEYFL